MKKKHTQALHVSVIGIDGSGKSTFAASLPMLLAAEYQLQAGGAGETYVVNTPDEDHLTSGFTPDDLPFTARISALLKRWAKKFTNHRRIYPFLKVATDDGAGRRRAPDGIQVVARLRSERRQHAPLHHGPGRKLSLSRQ